MFRMLHVPVVAIIVFTGIESLHADEPKRVADRTDRWQKLRKECEDYIRKQVARPLPKEPEFRRQSLRFIEELPLRFTRKRLLAALDDPSGSVRLTAADILTAKEPSKNREKIEKAIRSVKPADGVATVRREAIRLRFGHKGAAKALRSWAWLSRVGKRLDSSKNICAMHPQIRRHKKGACPICAMELVKIPGDFNYASRHAQELALTALADQKDKSVPYLAAQMLAGRTDPERRLHAAIQWTRVDPKAGLPHVRVFLLAGDVGIQALRDSARYFPRRCAKEYAIILSVPNTGKYTRSKALAGLTAAGNPQALKRIRRLLQEKATANKMDLFKDPLFNFELVSVLADHGTREDLDLLAKWFHKIPSADDAAAILRLLERTTP